ncbi:hypothetical protein ABZS29_26360 [Kribbella sp. NPDC005582]|uniref:hypothetical protein n=1 Tax=Kribbella sp. NPDC005582 TaxID=3156893 RepID=UPI0033A2EF4F
MYETIGPATKRPAGTTSATPLPKTSSPRNDLLAFTLQQFDAGGLAVFVDGSNVFAFYVGR